MKKIALTFAILMIPASAALADQPRYTGGMKYTTMRSAQTSDTDKKPIYNRITPKTEENNAEETPEEKPAEETVWDRYKELAAGKEKAPETEKGSALPKAPKTPNKPAKPEQQATNEETQRPSGMAGLIQEYQRNRNKRSQMRSISFSKPETPEVEKPDVNVED